MKEGVKGVIYILGGGAPKRKELKEINIRKFITFKPRHQTVTTAFLFFPKGQGIKGVLAVFIMEIPNQR